MNNFNYITKFLLMCAGADLTTMAQCTPSEVNKYRIMGTCVLIPTMLALFSGGYTMYLISGSLVIACLFAPVWSLVIFILDRAVVFSTRPGKLSLAVIARMCLAVVIAFTISEPVILKLFSDAIEDKRLVIVDDKQHKATVGIDEQLAVLKNESQTEKLNLDNLNRSYIQEVDGTGGSGVPFSGPIAAVKLNAYQNAQAEFDKNELLRSKEVQLLTVNKTAKLALVKDKDAKGFLGNMKILGNLMDEDSHVWWCVWMVRLLFLAIELVPVMIKLGNASDFELYIRLKDMNDRNQETLQNELVEAKTSVSKLAQLLLIEIEKYRLQLENTKAAMNSSLRTYEFFLEKIRYASEQKMKSQLSIIEKVKDEKLRATLIDQVDQAYNGYIATLESLITKSKYQHSSAGL